MINQVKFVALAALSLFSINSNAALTGYSANGVDLVYSSVSNITWTKDANLLGSMIADQGYAAVVDAIIAASPTISNTPNEYDTPEFSGVYTIARSDFSSGVPGRTNWFGAMAFVNYLNSINYAGSNQWALPSANIGCGRSINCANSVMGSLYYSELGLPGGSNPPSSSYFSNDNVPSYWLSTEQSGEPMRSYQFWWHMSSGGEQIEGPFKANLSFARPYSPGLVSSVPLPAAGWLFGGGLLGLIGRWKRP